MDRSKTKAVDLALLAAIACGSIREDFVGKCKVDMIRNVIASSPVGLVMALLMPPLPDNVLDVLTNTVGSREDWRERMNVTM